MKGKKVELYLHPWQGHVTQGLLYFNILMDEGKIFMVNNVGNDFDSTLKIKIRIFKKFILKNDQGDFKKKQNA